MRRLGFVGLVCSGVSLGLIIISMVIPDWERSYGMTKVSVFGLWMWCSHDKDKEEAVCYELTDVPEFVLAVRSFALLGLFLVTFAAILKLIHLFVKKENQNISILAGVIAIGAGICMLIAVVIYAGRMNELSGKVSIDYHVGFVLAIIAGIVAIISGVMFIVGKTN